MPQSGAKGFEKIQECDRRPGGRRTVTRALLLWVKTVVLGHDRRSKISPGRILARWQPYRRVSEPYRLVSAFLKAPSHPFFPFSLPVLEIHMAKLQLKYPRSTTPEANFHFYSHPGNRWPLHRRRGEDFGDLSQSLPLQLNLKQKREGVSNIPF